MMSPALQWVRREPPLEPVAVTSPSVGCSALRAATRRRLRSGAALRVAVGEACLLVIGLADDLPWCVGAVYLGWDGGLLMPTTKVPVQGATVVAAAVARRVPAGHDLVALLPWGILAAPMPVEIAAETALAEPVSAETAPAEPTP